MYQIFSSNIAIIVACSFVFWNLFVVLYRLLWSPLAKFPGPKLAAATWLYEFYFDVVKPGGGLYMWKIKELHQQYGPIVRINPEELHIADPEFYDTIYAGTESPRNKWGAHQKGAQADGSMGHTEDYRQHRNRKDAISHFFSKRSIWEREPMINAKVDHLCQRLDEYFKAGRPVNLTVAYLALTMDTITEYAFGKEYGLLKEDDFNEKWKNTVLSIVSSVTTVVHLPWFPIIMRALPTWITAIVAPHLSVLMDYENRVEKQVSGVLAEPPFSRSTKSGNPTIFEELRDSPKLNDSEKSLKRLTDEGNVLLIAGSETPAKVLALITYHLVEKKTLLNKLREEVLEAKSIHGSQLDLNKLEKLPWLTAIIKEGLRLHCGVVARSQRISPYSDLQYKQWTIPAGTPMSCTSIFMNHNPKVFPDPTEFHPERWMVDEDTRKYLQKHSVSFGRGTRSCLGCALSVAQIHLVLAAIVTNFDMELYETNRSDVDLERDWFIPQASRFSKGVRVLIKKSFIEN